MLLLCYYSVVILKHFLNMFFSYFLIPLYILASFVKDKCCSFENYSVKGLFTTAWVLIKCPLPN